MRNWLLDQIIIQSVLNVAICLVVWISALLINTTTFSLRNFFVLFLLILLGIYLCAFGFLIGVFIDGKTIAALSMPLVMLIGLLIVPINTWVSGKFVDVLTAIQKFFPGYYLFEIIQKIDKSISFTSDFWKFMLSLVLLVVPIVFIKIRYKKI